jgi:hypothetical protein
LHDSVTKIAYFAVPKSHWQTVTVDFSKSQNKVRFHLHHLEFPVSTCTIEGKAVAILTFACPEGYEIVKGWDDQDWKGIELKPEAIEKNQAKNEWETL